MRTDQIAEYSQVFTGESPFARSPSTSPPCRTRNLRVSHSGFHLEPVMPVSGATSFMRIRHDENLIVENDVNEVEWEPVNAPRVNLRFTRFISIEAPSKCWVQRASDSGFYCFDESIAELTIDLLVLVYSSSEFLIGGCVLAPNEAHARRAASSALIFARLSGPSMSCAEPSTISSTRREISFFHAASISARSESLTL